MPNAWQDYAALIFTFYNRGGINTSGITKLPEDDLLFIQNLYKEKLYEVVNLMEAQG